MYSMLQYSPQLRKTHLAREISVEEYMASKPTKCNSFSILRSACVFINHLFQMVCTLNNNGANNIWEHALLENGAKLMKKKPNAKDPIR